MLVHQAWLWLSQFAFIFIFHVSQISFTACLFFPFIESEQLFCSQPVISVKRHLKHPSFFFTIFSLPPRPRCAPIYLLFPESYCKQACEDVISYTDTAPFQMAF